MAKGYVYRVIRFHDRTSVSWFFHHKYEALTHIRALRLTEEDPKVNLWRYKCGQATATKMEIPDG